MIRGSLILNLNVNWFLYHSLLDLLLPMDKSDMTGMGSMLPELAAVFKASKLVSVNKIARVISKHKLAIWYINPLGLGLSSKDMKKHQGPTMYMA